MVDLNVANSPIGIAFVKQVESMWRKAHQWRVPVLGRIQEASFLRQTNKTLNFKPNYWDSS
jgi:hypothetical protein